VDVEALIKALPKVEQHVHIVGSTRPETLLWLLNEGGLKKTFEAVKDVRQFFQYRDFPHFINVYSMVFRCITQEDQFERITYEMLEDDARCNVRYVEASFSAPDHVREGLDYGLMLDAINRGVYHAHQDFGIQCNLRIDLVRNYGPEAGMQVLEWIRNKSDNIVSIDIGGSEEQFPPKPFLQVYQRAKEMGLHLVAHAGEAAGPESIWDAVNHLNVEHIGHGVTASRDPELIDYLLKRDIAIEMCPTSNLRTGVVASLRRHPIRTFFDKGIKVTVNTDDPSMFNTNMNNEYLQLHQQLNFTVSELFKLTLNALDSSFLPETRKMQIRESFTREYRRLMDALCSP
jgi:adenosine deaminase